MSGESGRGGFSEDRAELFEALGHPTRIRMLQALAESPLGFSDLKRKLDIESSGQLQFHLGKMKGLVNGTPEGNYTLTDNGRDALRTVVAQTRPENTPPAAGKRRRRIMAALAVLLVLSIATNAGQFCYANSLNQFTLVMEDFRFERVRIVNFTLFETEEGEMWMFFNWEAYCMNPADSPVGFLLERIRIYIELESSNCSVGIVLQESKTSFPSKPFTEWVRANPHSPVRINGTCYFGPYGPEHEGIQRMTAMYNCLVEEGFNIKEITIQVTLSSGLPFVQLEKTLSLSHEQISLRRY